MANSQPGYIPGACNIGRSEIRLRRWLGWIALAVTIALGGALFYLDTAPRWRLALFFPAVGAALGFLQARWQFCVKFGLEGTYHFGPNVGDIGTVKQAEFRRQDRRTALKIIGLAVLAGAVVAVGAYLMPL